MGQRLKQRIDDLLEDADEAITPTANGLFDRGDCIHMIERFVGVTESLMKANERLEARENELEDRLRRTCVSEES